MIRVFSLLLIVNQLLLLFTTKLSQALPDWAYNTHHRRMKVAPVHSMLYARFLKIGTNSCRLWLVSTIYLLTSLMLENIYGTTINSKLRTLSNVLCACTSSVQNIFDFQQSPIFDFSRIRCFCEYHVSTFFVICSLKNYKVTTKT